MKVSFVGMGHLGQTLRLATIIRGMDVTDDDRISDLIFVTEDVEGHNRLAHVDWYMRYVLKILNVPIVLVSQVPPGYTRKWNCPRLFYQVDTIIVAKSLRRAVMPERIIIGCPDGIDHEHLPEAYLYWLKAFECSIYAMPYESAEMVKLAVNYFLTAQICVTNRLAAVSKLVGADWNRMIPAIESDGRIGSYLSPGQLNQHLLRDVNTVDELYAQCTDDRGRRQDRPSSDGKTSERGSNGGRNH